MSDAQGSAGGATTPTTTRVAYFAGFRDLTPSVSVSAEEIIVMGTPSDVEDENHPDYHNCDAMGCGMAHVIFRSRLAPEPPAVASPVILISPLCSTHGVAMQMRTLMVEQTTVGNTVPMDFLVCPRCEPPSVSVAPDERLRLLAPNWARLLGLYSSGDQKARDELEAFLVAILDGRDGLRARYAQSLSNANEQITELLADRDALRSSLQAETARLERLTLAWQELRHFGGMLSNIAYNLAQQDAMVGTDRESLGMCRRNWDRALENQRDLFVAPPETTTP